jgi:hypothetical protein
MKEIRIPVVTRHQDCGDGGYTTYLFNDEDELITNHPISRYGNKMTEEMKKKILQEDDPYENGYIGNDVLTIIQEDDGTFRLGKDNSFHFGQ